MKGWTPDESDVCSAKPFALSKRLGVDVMAALLASLNVSPFIAIIDRGIIENANGSRPLFANIKHLLISFFTNPLQFVFKRREFHLVYGLYAATYATANISDTLCEWKSVDKEMPKFLNTTAVNMTLCIAKDRAFARMFGTILPTAFPLSSIALFAVRDSLTVAASFNAPKILAKNIQAHSDMENGKASIIAQLFCPAAIQFISTPLHLLGLDLYNNRNATYKYRFQFIKKEYIKSAAARIGRIGPAFGLGSIGNNFYKAHLRVLLE
uniref:Uncharacterized protein AlNc14C160G7759 n=1 Tax=Albugo laibachii Nc14 TaxID=890382 RepID=F0WMS3_9STRA|nr:conserved hypothetical protein [Albugo laibachii Nc14]|eukprot:CCA22608.1 conserved hypothetical protein [Albugo laibachii Nc14]